MPLSGNELGDAIRAAVAAVDTDDFEAYADYQVAVCRALGNASIDHLTDPGNLVGADTPGLVPAIGSAGAGDVLQADGEGGLAWAPAAADLADGNYGAFVVSGGMATIATSVITDGNVAAVNK